MEILNPQDNYSGFRDTFIGYVIGIVIAFILCIITSCASTKTVEQVNVRDSIVYQYRDSIIYHYRDSVNIITQHVQLDDSTHLFIQFGQSGGTYNAKTGEATNVAGVQQTDTHHEQRDSTAYYRNLFKAAKMTCYELQAEASDYKHELENERTTPKRSGYDRFCSWWFWITAILLLIKIAAWVMEKIPTTAPYIIIARRFIPFL